MRTSKSELSNLTGFQKPPPRPAVDASSAPALTLAASPPPAPVPLLRADAARNSGRGVKQMKPRAVEKHTLSLLQRARLGINGGRRGAVNRETDRRRSGVPPGEGQRANPASRR